MGNQVRPRRGTNRSKRASDRRKTEPGRRKVEMIALHHEAHCGPSRKRRGGLRSLFRIGLVALLLLAPLLATTVFGYTTTLDPPPESNYWTTNAPQAGGDPQRSGSADFRLLDTEPDLRWQTDGYAPFLAGPVMDQSNAYVVDRKGVVSALNLSTGDEAWRTDLKQEVRATPALAYGWLYIATEAKELHALSAQSGTEIHKVKLAGAARAPPLVTEGRVFVGTETGKLQVFDATTLDELWSFETSTKGYTNGTVDGTDKDLLKPIRAAATAYDGVVYVGAWNARGYAMTTHGNLKGNPHALLWTATLGDLVNAAPVVDRHRDLVYFATGDGKLQALNRGPGSVSWWIDAGDAFTGSVAVNATHLVAATTDGRLIGVAPKNGAVLWEAYEPSGYIASPVLLDDSVVALTANGTLSLRSALNGTLLARDDGTHYTWKLPDGTHATPAVTRKGVVVVDQGGHVALVGPRPDLVSDLSGVLRTTGNLTTAAPVALVGKVTNGGRDMAPDVQATLTLDDKVIETKTLGRLDPGASAWWNLTLGMAAGAHTVKMTFIPIDSRDPTPGDAVARTEVQVQGPDTSNGTEDVVGRNGVQGPDVGNDPDGAGTGTDDRGFVDGVTGAWTGWMVPIALVALVGGVFLGRYVKERGKGESAGTD